MDLEDHFKAALLETIPCSVFIIDRNRQVIFWNRSAEELTGILADEVIGTNCAGVYQRLCGGQEVDESMCPFTTGDRIGESECELMRKDGSVVPVMRRSRLVYDAAGEVAGAIEALVNVSLIKNARNEIRRLKHQLAESGGLGDLIGRSEQMRHLFGLIRMVAESDASVVIEGETGTGKELVARTIHQESERARQTFLAVNCGALPEGLLEAELFGHVKGAFTGAVSDRVGCFEAATGGTLFLDEIGELSLLSQVKLLRALQEGEITRVGDTRPRKVDVRIIAATNRNLQEMVREGTFREDLYYRLRVVSIQVPALRERKGDIDELVASFINKFNLKYKKQIERCVPEAMAFMERYQWPGNVRELEHAIEHAFVVTGRDKNAIELEALPVEITGGQMTARLEAPKKSDTHPQDERQELIEALEQAAGNKARAARQLGLTRAGLYKRMKRLGIN